jgi:hypothetical protein
VVKGQPEAIAQRVATDGDVYYGGAPYMMDDFIRAHPGVGRIHGAGAFFAPGGDHRAPGQS